MYGFEWLLDVFKQIQADRRDHYLYLMAIAPLSRTPMEDKAARGLDKYTKDLRRMFYGLTPWEGGGGRQRSAWRGKVASGTLAVVLDEPGMKNHPTFKGAKIVKG